MSYHGDTPLWWGDKTEEEMNFMKNKRKEGTRLKGKVDYFIETDEPINLLYADYDGEVVPNVEEIVCIHDVYYEVEVIIVNPIESSVNVILEEME